jgi:hypothetical protein
MSMYRGCAYATLDQSEHAVKGLEAAADDSFAIPISQQISNLDNLRSNPRFVALMSAFQKQWEHFGSLAGLLSYPLARRHIDIECSGRHAARTR